MNTLIQALLIGLIAAYGVLDYQLGTLYTFRPIVLGPLVGLVLGDLGAGLTIGASLELFFMGAISVGAYIPPNVIAGGVLATAYAISLGKGVDAAITLAMPIALLVLALDNFVNALLPLILKIADNGAAEGNPKKIRMIHWAYGLVGTAIKFVVVFLAFYLGADAMQNVLDMIPQVIIDGMGVAAGLLPAMGFAMLMRMILNKKLIPFYFLGFVMSAYLNLPVLGVAIVGIIIVIEKFGLLEPRPAAAAAAAETAEEVDDDDF